MRFAGEFIALMGRNTRLALDAFELELTSCISHNSVLQEQQAAAEHSSLWVKVPVTLPLFHCHHTASQFAKQPTAASQTPGTQPTDGGPNPLHLMPSQAQHQP
jgi:hypothetical protein